MIKKSIATENNTAEAQLFTRRIWVVAILLLLLLMGIVVRLFILQVCEHSRYTTLSKQNQLSFIPIPPNRGLIYDRNGVLLAENLPVFSLDLIPDKIPHVDETIQALSQLINISDDDIKAFHTQFAQHHRFDEIPLKLKLTPSEVATFYVNQYRFPGVLIKARLLRYYPLGDAMVDVLGYVGRINAKELRQVDPTNYSDTNYIGKLGIEKQYEATLHGTVGIEQIETDASGRLVRTLDHRPPIPGNDLYLTIDSQLQIAAKMALGRHRGAVVALDPNTGQVLAMVSNPAYDPNLFVNGISQKRYQQLHDSPDQPLFNRAIRGRYPPGSIVKPFYALMGLSQKTITPDTRVYDKGWYQLPNSTHHYRGWKRDGLGWLNLHSAIVQSSDPYFYELAYKLGIKHLDAILEAMGFGEQTHLDIGEELPGVVPSPAWKRAYRGKPWYPGDTVITGIGQGFLLVTPIQMASAVGTLATRGDRFKPYLLLKQQSPDKQDHVTEPVLSESVVLDDEIWSVVIKAMEGVANDPNGTGFRFGQAPYQAAIKTGTAQVFSIKQDQTYNASQVPERLRDHSTFIAFAPVKHPKIALAVVVENSPDAPNVARKIMDSYLLRKKT